MPGPWSRFKAWGKERVVDPFVEYMKQDAEPKILARSATLGFLLGLCPIMGVSTLLCLLACYILGTRLHGPMALLFNLVAIPVELLLIIPFMRFGEVVLRAERIDVIPEHFKDLFRPGDALKGLGHAIVGWLIISALVCWPISLALTPLFAVLRRKYSQIQRVSSDEGALLDGLASRDDRSTASDLEMARGSAPPSPLGSRGLSPRSNSAPSGLPKLSPRV